MWTDVKVSTWLGHCGARRCVEVDQRTGNRQGKYLAHLKKRVVDVSVNALKISGRRISASWGSSCQNTPAHHQHSDRWPLRATMRLPDERWRNAPLVRCSGTCRDIGLHVHHTHTRTLTLRHTHTHTQTHTHTHTHTQTHRVQRHRHTYLWQNVELTEFRH